jgi:hypothetical protein
MGSPHILKNSRQPLVLCSGTQSSGSTLVSWCFLQRADTDGVFDARGDELPDLPDVDTQLLWCKFTIQCFRYQEVMAYFQDQGWDVRPLLVVRDLRAVFNSLIKKSYGSNGTTAEQPPLRLRLRRFKEDWELFQSRQWPILKYETLVADGERVLRDCCRSMRLQWDKSMLTWPKNIDDIADAAHGSPTFRARLASNFAETVSPELVRPSVSNIPPDDHEWLEKEFEEFNTIHGYPPHIKRNHPWPGSRTRAVPAYENTRRYALAQRKHRLKRLTIGLPKTCMNLLNGKPNKLPGR